MAFRWKNKKFWAAMVLIAVALGGLAVKRTIDSFGVSLVLSKETTYITEPLRKDGMPDYLAALNRRIGEGVTPESNAAVLFWQAMGPDTIAPNFRAKFFQMLGIPTPPEKGKYFIALDAYLKQPSGEASSDNAESQDKRCAEVLEQCDKAMRRPWSKKEFPILADWLAANEKPLDLLIQASRRSRRYDPMVGEEDVPIIEMALTAVGTNRNASRALTMRAMLQLGENRVDDVWQDLLACHRLARLTGCEQTLIINVLIAMNMEQLALDGDQALLQYAGLTAAQIAKMRDDLAHLPPRPNIADTFDFSERLMCLDSMMTIARRGTTAWGKLTGGKVPSGISPNAAFDCNIPLRMINSGYDQIVAAARKPTRIECYKECKEIESNFMAEVYKAKSWSAKCSAIVSPREARSKLTGLIFLSLMMPSCAAACDADGRITMQRELTDLAFALAAYRADHGAYPKTLAELAPKYVAKVPKDFLGPNGNADLHYRSQKDGYLLYSVGINGKDDGGIGYADCPGGIQDGRDDLNVRMNWSEKP